MSQEVDCGSSQTADWGDQMRNVRELEEQNCRTASRCHYGPHSSVSLDFGVHWCLIFRLFRVCRCGLSHQVRFGSSNSCAKGPRGGAVDERNVRSEASYVLLSRLERRIDDARWCRNCYILRLAERSDSKVTNARWKTMIEQKVSRGKLSTALRTDGFVKRMWEKYSAKKVWTRELLEVATRAVQLVTHWQDESPHQELELLRVSIDMRLDGTLIRQALKAGKAGDWWELVKKYQAQCVDECEVASVPQ